MEKNANKIVNENAGSLKWSNEAMNKSRMNSTAEWINDLMSSLSAEPCLIVAGHL